MLSIGQHALVVLLSGRVAVASLRQRRIVVASLLHYKPSRSTFIRHHLNRSTVTIWIVRLQIRISGVRVRSAADDCLVIVRPQVRRTNLDDYAGCRGGAINVAVKHEGSRSARGGRGRRRALVVLRRRALVTKNRW
ncbi:hypothetical protein BD626DRAFT_60785 [Schizophyllum amplum]|uniref:Secreted protein n=1 Tax=Schizophyllum amplum TaxID=97359 RepID=A0A550CCH4_9AGAR|nr:hypothetical protein BD626DRAFT_60785 [Auriculariopsis ampla]